MTILIDTGVFYAFFDKKDPHYIDSSSLLLHCLEGRRGQPFTTDYVVLETTVLTQRRLGAEVSLSFLDFLRDSGIRTIAAGQEYYDMALGIFREKFPRLSLCDTTTIVVMNGLGAETLASYDERSFKGLAREVIGVGYYDSLSKDEQIRVRKRIEKKS